ncbi:MAG: hypothetical protein DYG98_20485 [Haliscomenobacteraceae bacterium CHB4]|nr:hypothetical protein [Saprospiraceae bacterium]MCE7925439.1 hypothetical protein [Haliscomenobacteraceae bacterium CHB4]
MKTLLFFLSALAFFSAEKCKKKSPGGDASNLVSLETGPCFGFCPVFKLEVLNNGFVRYNGERFVEKVGKDSFYLTRTELKQLKEKIQSVNLWQYPDMIKTDVVDAPFATLIAYEGEKSKTVRGSIDRPAPLLELEGLLKDLAEAHGLQLKRGINPNSPPSGTMKEVIVQLKPDVNAGNWVNQFTEFKLRLVRRISAENIWIVAFDPKQIEEKALIDVLKDMDGVVEVQTNMPAKDRN